MKKLLLHILLLLAVFTVSAQGNFDPESLLKSKPPGNQLVFDYTQTLTADQQNTIEQKLEAFDKETSTQIAVVIIPTLGNYEINDYNTKLGRAWGVGGKDNNNGVVLLIAKNDRKLNIATGYGVEGALPDITCAQIIDDIIKPNFKGEDYYAGINLGTDAIIQATKGEYKAPPGYGKSKGRKSGWVIGFIVVMVLLALFSRGGGGGGSYMSRRGGAGWIIPMLLSGGGGRGGGWGGGGGSSGGGGGFGGFGGGSFGGGGASGSW
ncbi:MAG: TPM domain-containing protein [Ferruginibacter sp.]